jgi:hypothetical protein
MDTEVHDVGAIEDENVKPKRPNMNVSDADAATPAKRRRVSKQILCIYSLFRRRIRVKLSWKSNRRKKPNGMFN